MWQELITTYATPIAVTVVGLGVVYLRYLQAVVSARAQTQVERTTADVEREQIANDYERFRLQIMRQVHVNHLNSTRLVAELNKELIQYRQENNRLQIEIARSRAKTEELIRQLDVYRQTYASDMKDKDARHDQLQIEIEQLRTRLDEVETELREEKQARMALTAERDRLQERSAALQRANASLSDENQRLKHEMTDLRQQLARLETQINELREKHT